MRVKIEGELYERRNCCPCRNDNEVCNYCKWKPVDEKNHKHKFFILTKRYKNNLFKISTIEYDLECPCGKRIRGVEWN